MRGVVLTTVDSLRLWLAASPAITQPSWVVSYLLVDTTTTLGSVSGVFAGTSPLTALAAPTSGKIVVTRIDVFNGDTSPCRVFGGKLTSSSTTTFVSRPISSQDSSELLTLPAYTPQGDMTKAEYDPNGDGIIDAANPVAHSSSHASGGVDEVTPAAIGAATAAQGATADSTASALASHTSNTSNPHAVTKAQVELGNCDNTSDANKPVSTAQATTIATGDSVLTPNSLSADYTLVLTDAGKALIHPAADTTARTWTIPANASVAFAVGTVLTIANTYGAGIISLAITTDTLYLAGSSLTGTRSISSGGLATLLKVAATTWMVSGAGVS